MSEESSTLISQAVQRAFVGRSKALAKFREFCDDPERIENKNGIYYYGKGGLGKTWLLKKIQIDHADDPRRLVPDLIDFFDTQNHSIRGLQATIQNRLRSPDAFVTYDDAIARMDGEQAKGEAVHPNVLASLEARANQRFIECCRQAVAEKEVILLFDTYERVQGQHVGQWLTQDFLARVRENVLFAIAGRPGPEDEPAPMPDNAETFQLEGLELDEVAAYVQDRHPGLSDEDIQSIWEHTAGEPLTIQLILDHLQRTPSEQFIQELGRLGEGKLIQQSVKLQRELVSQFALPTRRSRVIWAMAYLRRRFDVNMLQYIVENSRWFSPGQYDEIFDELCEFAYIKEHPHLESHLLHDEIQRLISEFILEQVDPGREMRNALYGLVVERYYPEAIAGADPNLKRQLESEWLGYTLDEYTEAGLDQYKSLQDYADTTRDYAFEELLWSEVREHMVALGDKAYAICFQRGGWLNKHNLFAKAEDHYRYMVNRFREQPGETREYLGFVLMLQGRLPEAEQVLQEGLAEIAGTDDYGRIAAIESTFGHVKQVAGQWDDAIEHYARSFRAAAEAGDNSQMASVFINRGYLYSLQGQYNHAKKQCQRAINLLGSSPKEPVDMQRTIYAWMNLGTAYRHDDDYETAAEHYAKSLELAEASNNRQAMAYALGHIGINAHLWGRSIRREVWGSMRRGAKDWRIVSDQDQLNDVCAYQWQAWQNLTGSIEIASEADWRDALAQGFNRLAKVYREIERLQILVSASEDMLKMPYTLSKLHNEAGIYRIPLEAEYETRLLFGGYFEDLDGMAKVARLFELAALLADEVDDVNRELGSLTELSRALIELDRGSDVLRVLDRIDQIRSYDYRQEVFAATTEITRGDLAFVQGRTDAALEQYQNGFAHMAQQSDYALYLLRDRLRDLEIRLQDLPPQTAREWCLTLEQAWSENALLVRRPEMRDSLERALTDALERSDRFDRES